MDGSASHGAGVAPGHGRAEGADIVAFVAGDVVRFDVPLDAADGDWVLLRVSDPAQANATPGPDGHACNDLGIAYTSPWWLEPA